MKNIITIPTKTILSTCKSNDQWYNSNYNMNIYRGCSHGCIYCDSRSSCYGIENFDEIKVKKDAISIITNELASKRKKGIIITGAMSDPYNPVEKHLKLMRSILDLIDKNRFGIVIDTKSDLVLRDIDLLLKIKMHSPVIVNFTITTFDDILCKKIETNIISSTKRFEAIKTLTSYGIPVGILFMPILPFINDNVENITNITNYAHECGVKFINHSFSVTLRQNQRLYFYDKLDQSFPGVKKMYLKYFNNVYDCKPLNIELLEKTFYNECEKLNLIYDMNKINTYIKHNMGTKQLTFL